MLRSLQSGGCFSAGTVVAMCDGSRRPIESVTTADSVLSRNEDGELECHRVVRTFERVTEDRVDLTLAVGEERETLHTTLEHPFWIEGRGWVRVRDIDVGAVGLAVDGRPVTVVGLLRSAGSGVVFNIEVAGTHNYFVGGLATLAHNGCGEAKSGGGGATPAAEGLKAAATRRLATTGDTQFRTAADALAEALERHGIDPSTVETTAMYGKNPNLIGPQGQPWQMIRGLNADGELIEFEHHASGHFFGDANEFELPHYHGPNGEHLTY